MERNKIKFAIVGVGNAARMHAQTLAALESAQLIAVCGRDEVRTSTFAAEYGVRYFIDYEEMFNAANPDVVNVCTPSGAHLEPAIAAARTGKHVLVEKPIEISVERARYIIDACQKANVKLACMFQHRFDLASQRIKNAVDREEFGRLIYATASVKWFRPASYYQKNNWRGTFKGDGGGALINQAIHTIDLMAWIMGKPLSIFGKTATFIHQIEGEDTGAALISFDTGAFGIIEGMTSAYPGFPERLEIHGERGTVILEGGNIKSWDLIDAKQDAAELTSVGNRVGSSDPMAISIESHKALLQDMIEAIVHDRQPFVSGSQAITALEVVRAIYQSAQEGREIVL
ncbi:MAG TPA: Gfo/Idh/MocA family oxidoreductase [bacterium]|nr:Gfo/Idh/MocA family oxidoreductase [bacterium]